MMISASGGFLSSLNTGYKGVWALGFISWSHPSPTIIAGPLVYLSTDGIVEYTFLA